MRIAVDARPALDPRRTGVGIYADRLIRSLPAATPRDTVVAWYLHAKGLLRPRRFFPDVAEPNLEEHASRFPARIFQPVSSRAGVPRIEWLVGFDVFLATNFVPPPTGAGEVVPVVHDLAFERFPETAPHMTRRWRRRFETTLRSSAAVIVPSSATRGDLLHAWPIDGARVHVVPHGVDASLFAAPGADAVERVRRRLAVDGPYLLFLGGIEPRKNLRTLVRAFANGPRGSCLVIAGGPVRWFPQEAARVRAEIEQLPADVRGRVRLIGYVADGDKAALLAGATALTYPSRYEGFGFPVLEAMAAGTPVLSSNVSSLPEVAGDAALLVDPSDEQAIAEAMVRLVEDASLRDRLREAGRVRAAAFTWKRTAALTAEVLREAASSAG